MNMAANKKIRLQSICNSTRRASSKKPANTASSPYNGRSKSRHSRKTAYSPTQLSNSGRWYGYPSVFGVFTMSRAGKLNQVSASRLNIIAAPNGAIWPMKPRKERPERLHSRIFCGLPIGVSNEPAFTASAWKMIKRPTGSADSFSA